ncbi:hypothetical protein [Pseudomonas rhodesiae]|uniref:hypothetical protein n=1 Tax=Pseudomonas rhodesiae TaxID=76760 RepID=UPI0017E8812B
MGLGDIHFLQGEQRPAAFVGFRKNQVGLGGLESLYAAHGHMVFNSALATATANPEHLVVTDGSMTGEDCAYQHYQMARDATAEQFCRDCRTTSDAELVENTLNRFFDGAGSAANDTSNFLVGQASADSKGGTQLLFSKYAGGALELAEIDNRAHLFHPSHSLLMDKNISRFI